MKLLIDDANIEKIRKIYEYYAVDGVTTNPSILAKNGKNPYETLKEIREFIGEDAELHVQVVSSTAEEMIVFFVKPSIISGATVEAPTPYSQSSNT